MWCYYHGRYHKGRVQKAACLISIVLDKDFGEAVHMAAENKKTAKKMGKGYSMQAVVDALQVDSVKRKKIYRKKFTKGG